MQNARTGIPNELLERYCQNHRVSFVASLLLCAMLAVSVWEHVKAADVITWLVLVLVTQVAQTWYVYRYLRTSGVQKLAAANWMPGLLLASIATGASWGAAFFILGLTGNSPIALLLIFSIAGVSAYGAIAKSDVLPLGMSFEISILLPLSIWLFFQAGALPHAQYMGMIALLYLALLYFLLRQINAIVMKAYTLHHENSELNEALARVKALKRESVMFRNMFEMISDPAITVHDPQDEMRIVYANTAACRHLGVDEETVLTLRPGDFDVRLNEEKFALMLDRLEQHGRFAFQSVHRRASGEEVPVEVLLNTFEHEGAELGVSLTRNINSRLVAEQRMRELEQAAMRQESDQRIGRYLECVPGLFFTLRRDRDGKLSMPFARGSSTSFQGLSPETVADSIEPLLALCHPDDTATLLAELHASALSLRPCHVEFRIGDQSEGMMTMELTAQPQASAEDAEIMEWHGFMQDVSGRKRMEEQLSMKGHALENSSEAMYLIGEQGRFVYVNEQACRVLGYSREELLTMGVADIDPEFKAEFIHERPGKLQEEGGSFTFETMHRRRDGSTFPVEIQLSELAYNGRTLGMTLARDISERKRAEQALAESSQMLRDVLQGIPDPVWMKDVEGVFVVCNHGVARLFNKPVDEIIGKDDYDFFSPEQAEFYQNKDRAALEAGQVLLNEEWWTFGDNGEQVLMETCKTPVRNQAGKLLGVLGVARNITERKRMEEMLQERERLLHEAQRIAHVGSWDVDMVNDKLTWSDEIFRIWEIDKAKFKADFAAFVETVHPDDRERVVQVYNDSVVNHTFYEVEHRLLFPDGRVKHILERGEPQYDAQGKPVRFIGTSLEITERKRVEELLAARERDFRSLAENMPDNIARFDVEGRYLFVNPVHERTLGKSASELIGTLLPDSHEHVRAAIDQVVASGQAIHAVCQPVIVNGVEELHDVSIVPEFDVAGEVVSVLGLGRDMTERYRLQDALAARERDFRSLAENMPDNVARWDTQSRYTYLNSTHEQTLGMSAKDVLGKSLTEVFGFDLPDGMTGVEKVLATGKPLLLERVSVPGKDGEIRFHDVNVVPEFDEAGNIVSALGIGRDMTGIYRMQDALAAREHEFRSLAESSPDFIIRYDLQHRIRYLNSNLLRLLGINAEDDVLGKHPIEVWPDGRFKAIDDAAVEVLESGVMKMVDLVSPDEHGELDYHNIYVVPERDASGQVIGTIAFGRDVTHLQRVEQALVRREQEFRSLAENIPDHIVRWDVEGRYLYINPTHERLLGAPVSELPAMTFADSDEPLHVAFRQVVATGQPVQLEQRVPVADELEVHSVAVVPEFDDDGKLMSVLAVGRDMTAFYRMQDAVAEREAEFRTLVEQAPEPIIRYALDGRRIYVNAAVERISGIPASKLLEADVTDGKLAASDNGDQLLALVRKIGETGEGGEMEVENIGADGRHRWFNQRFAPEFDADGNVRSVLSICHDITERKQAVQALAERQAFLDSLFEAIPIPVFSKDLDGRYLKINRAFEQYYGTDREKMIGKSVFDTHPKALAETYHAKDIEVFEGNVALQQYEYQIKHGNGTLRDVLFSKAPFTDAQGKVNGLIGAVMDITERKQMEAELAEREAEFRSLAENSPDPIYRYDRACRRIYANAAVERLVGIPRESMLGKSPTEFVPVPSVDAIKAQTVIQSVIDSGERAELELSFLAADGQQISIHNVFVPEFDAAGEVQSVLCLGRDVTERKRAEQYESYRSHTLEHLSGDEPLRDILGEIVRGVERLDDRMLCSILLLDETGTRLVDGVAPSLPDYYNEAIEGIEIGPDVGSCGSAAATGVRVIVEDIQTHPNWAPFKQFAAQAGLGACWSQPILSSTGKVLGTFAIYHRAAHSPTERDISLIEKTAHMTSLAIERKRAEEAVRRSETRFRTLYDSTRDAVMLLDEQGFFDCNAATLEMFGCATQKAFCDKHPADLSPPVQPCGSDSMMLANQHIVQAIQEGGLRFEWVHRRADDGTCFPVEVLLSPMAMDGKQVLQATVRDITARKQAEAELQHRYEQIIALNDRLEHNARDLEEQTVELEASQEQLKDALEFSEGVINAIPDILFEMDRDGRYLNIWTQNPELLAAQRAALIGKTVHEVLPSESAEIAMAAIREADELGFTFSHTIPVVQLNGETRWFEHSLSKKQSGAQSTFIALSRDVTERVRSAQLLDDTRKRLHGVLQTIPDLVWMKDAEGIYLSCNHAFERFFGAKEEEIIGKTDYDFVDKELADFFRSNDVAAIEADRVRVNDEWVTFAEDGRHVLLETRKVPVHGADGSVIGVLGVARDITERKQMEEALALREQEYRSLLENTPDVVVRYDRECRRLYVNSAWERVNELSRDEVIGKSPLEISSRVRHMVPELMEMLRGVVQSGSPAELELEWISDTNEEVCFSMHATPEFDHSGSVMSVLTMSRDITQRKFMERLLAVREQESRTLLENTPDTIARYDRDCRRVYANAAMGNLVEGGQEALLGMTPAEWPGGSNAAIYEEKLREVFASGQATEFELNWPSNDGREICSLISLTPEFDQDGKVETILAVGRDISELNAFRDKIHQMAFYDPLTSLPNRALFNDRLRQMITDADWHGQTAGVMMIDMDRFKEVNDTMGHAVGDELLCETGARLTACVRAYDTVARLGGDEFAILLPDVRSGDDLGSVADKLLEKFKEPFLLEGREVFISCSIGIALYPDDSVNADDLLKFADSAMYYAKRSGRNNFRFYSSELTESAKERLMLESELRRAVERAELELHYQPKVSLEDGTMIGSEALLRWNHPQRGSVSPVKFIPVAEDSGLILEIGEWVLREACRMACEMNGSDRPLHKIAINLSARQFQSHDLVRTVCDVLDETGCYPEWIELEITESLLLDEAGEVLDILNAFRALGISIAIDDFGTGYSSLSYLARFPINTLKIDRSFINTVTTDHFRAELVKAMLSIAKGLGQQVVAEGVETAEQAEFLQAHGCQIAQGYLFSKPQARTAFLALPGRFDLENV